jgi:hypothetical protein
MPSTSRPAGKPSQPLIKIVSNFNVQCLYLTATKVSSREFSCGTDSGTIDSKELKSALQTLGHFPSDEELYVMMSLVFHHMSFYFLSEKLSLKI